MQWLEQLEFILLWFWRLEIWNSSYRESWFLLEGPGENLFLAFARSCTGILWLRVLSLQTLHLSSLHLYSPVSSCVTLISAFWSHLGLIQVMWYNFPTSKSLPHLLCKVPFAKKRNILRSWELGSRSHWEAIIQPSTYNFYSFWTMWTSLQYFLNNVLFHTLQYGSIDKTKFLLSGRQPHYYNS